MEGGRRAEVRNKVMMLLKKNEKGEGEIEKEAEKRGNGARRKSMKGGPKIADPHSRFMTTTSCYSFILFFFIFLFFFLVEIFSSVF